MPYPAQITPERIVDSAVDLIERHGAEQLSLHQLAAALGVKTPSLYRYFAAKSELLRAVNLRTAEGLVSAMREAAGQSAGSDAERIAAMAVAYRQYAFAHPHCYLLAYGSADESVRPDDFVLAALARQIEVVVAPLSTMLDPLTALRGLWALVHGFLALELTGQMRRGGDLDAAFRAVVGAYVRGLSK